MNTSNLRLLHTQSPSDYEHHFPFYFPVMQRAVIAPSVGKTPLSNFSSSSMSWNSKKVI